ncbi:hypothetical protein M8009_13060 [Halomonas sp. ATCH28]|uniref:Uncharacterized protein n=1 Tax=Halomonas gemina TaxID=2945105 RepID=A0ABT0T2Q7_9GAMM|nr:hypothetical protein [Halomonas gemina]MCL7941216.1 hypothetical protein [Halomonas gemina]
MSETIDLNALNKDELKEQAEILGIELKGNPTADTIRTMLREALGEPEPGAKASKAKASQVTYGHAIRPGEKIYTVEIHKDGKDKQPVFLSCNDRKVRVRRGDQVRIGAGIYESLKNAVESRYDAEAEEWIDVPSYPYTVLDVEAPAESGETASDED